MVNPRALSLQIYSCGWSCRFIGNWCWHLVRNWEIGPAWYLSGCDAWFLCARTRIRRWRYTDNFRITNSRRRRACNWRFVSSEAGATRDCFMPFGSLVVWACFESKVMLRKSLFKINDLSLNPTIQKIAYLQSTSGFLPRNYKLPPGCFWESSDSAVWQVETCLEL